MVQEWEYSIQCLWGGGAGAAYPLTVVTSVEEAGEVRCME
jgi:hypothetical protein